MKILHIMDHLEAIRKETQFLQNRSLLLGEILASLTMPQNQPYISNELKELIKTWNARYKEIK